mgnify:FL=1
MKTNRVEEQERVWNDTLTSSYESNDRTGVHVSDLTLCLRQTALSRKHPPVWDESTLYRFTMGRAMEKNFFSLFAPTMTQELEVKKDGIEGHIDFGSDPVDFECKLTWSREPETSDALFESKFWWLEQAGAYTYMRGRTKMNFVICFLNPVPKIRCYQVEWEQSELDELWKRFLENKEYLEVKEVKGELPMKTPLTWLCRGCAYKEVCDDPI